MCVRVTIQNYLPKENKETITSYNIDTSFFNSCINIHNKFEVLYKLKCKETLII